MHNGNLSAASDVTVTGQILPEMCKVVPREEVVLPPLSLCCSRHRHYPNYRLKSKAMFLFESLIFTSNPAVGILVLGARLVTVVLNCIFKAWYSEGAQRDGRSRTN